MLNTRAVARQRATLDLIEKSESSEYYRDLHATYSRLRREGGLPKLANPQTDIDKADRQAVMNYLNHYELIAIGIRENILDEKFYRSWMRGPFVRDWNAARDLIQRQRWKKLEDGKWEYYSQTFENYQYLACRWSTDVEYLSEESGGPPSADEAGGPGDEPLPPEKETPSEATA